MFQKEKQARNYRHGECYSATYKIWAGILRRCTNPNESSYPDYGGRGIGIDCRWRNYIEFKKDMGEKPSGMSIERKDNNGNYCKENCVWATKKAQCNNRRSNVFLVYNGKSMTISDWATSLGISYHAFYNRLTRWTLAEAIERPIQARYLIKKDI